MKKKKSKLTLYDVLKRLTAKGFNYPLSHACDGDICTYLKTIKL